MSARRMITGTLQLESPWFSNRWLVIQGDRELARVQRHGRLYVSDVMLADGTSWLIEPTGSGVVSAIEESGKEFARIERRSWLGRRWDVTSQQFAYELVSDPRPRQWHFTVGGATAADLSGSLVSYNTVTVDAAIGMPLVAVLLGWHVIARPWEAAAEPRGLVPSAAPDPNHSMPEGPI